MENDSLNQHSLKQHALKQHGRMILKYSKYLLLISVIVVLISSVNSIPTIKEILVTFVVGGITTFIWYNHWKKNNIFLFLVGLLLLLITVGVIKPIFGFIGSFNLFFLTLSFAFLFLVITKEKFEMMLNQ